MTNFQLAPPPTTVDGLAAVPIDIQHVDAALIFDGATSAGGGDATVEFIVHPAGGCPILDLRQTVTGAWLDGAAIAVADVGHHDFGGGTDAALRVVAVPLAGGSTHLLRLTYTLGTPQASTNGSYQPAMLWSAGPRLRFNFGFTDLGAGRYLESWIPANLIFDQHSLTVDLRILNTAIPHVVITNGTVAPQGIGRWTIEFPAGFTALSPLLEVHGADTVTRQTGTVTLPVSGTNVTIEAWKPVTSTVNLTTQLATLSASLAANETSTGRYLHGDRYVALLHVGGMEYDGATTSSVGSLVHEVFHSWWGRGVKPASQPDGWWDEAWNVHQGLGAPASIPFDFTAPPVQLSTRNPWSRVTPGSAYTAGERFFSGVAALIGAPSLRTHMRSFYESHLTTPTTTAELESHLVARSGAADLVDAFHRFVYGFPDPTSAPDLWIKDDPGDPGSDLWAGTFWNSPDLWIRHRDDGGTTHQPVEHGQDNWFHARVRNRGAATARHVVVTFNALPFAGTEFTYPTDFMPSIAASVGFELAAGASTVVMARWPADRIPPTGTHVCWLAAVLTRGEHPVNGRHVWEHNNLAQKNLVVVDVNPGDWFLLPLVLDRFRAPRRRITLELVRPRRQPTLEAALVHSEGRPIVTTERPLRARSLFDAPPAATARGRTPLLDCGGRNGAADPTVTDDAMATPFPAGPRSVLPAVFIGRGQRTVSLALRNPVRTRPGATIRIDLLQRETRTGKVIGGVSVELRTPRHD